MSRTGGEETRQRILDAAEMLFSEMGYSGTGVEAIARSVGINKASLYYHFGNKREILDALTEGLLSDVRKIVAMSVKAAHQSGEGSTGFHAFTEQLINLLLERRHLSRIIMMESLKAGEEKPILFRCAELLMDHETEGLVPMMQDGGGHNRAGSPEHRVHEFFTGFMPIFSFIAFADDWTRTYDIQLDNLKELFVAVFERSHMNFHVGETERE